MLEEIVTKHFVQPPEDIALVKKLDDIFDIRMTAMQGKHRKWMINLGFVRGQHWIKYDAPTRSIIDLSPKLSPRITINLVGAAVQNTLATLSLSNPTCDIIPAGTGDKDKRIAKTCQIHLNRIDRINHKSINDIRLRNNILSFGTAWKLIHWDEEIDPQLYTEVPQSVKDIEQLTAEKDVEATPGDVAEIIPSPFSILIDYPLVKKGEDIKDFIFFKLVSLEHIRNKWPDRGKYVSSEDGGSAAISELFKNTGDIFSSERPKNTVILKQYFEEKSKKHPQGRLIRWANGVKFDEGKLQNPDGKLGLLDYHWLVDSDDFYNISYVEPLIQPNVEINRIKTKQHNWLTKICKFRVAVPKSSKFNKSMYLSGEDGDVYEYFSTGGLGIQNMAIADLPPALFEKEKGLKEDFNNLAKGHIAPKQSEYPRMDSARGLKGLQERDTMFLTPAMLIWEERETEAARLKLELMREYYTKTRSVKIMGENRKVEIYNLKAGDITPNIDIKIVRGSAMPRSRSAQDDYILDIYTTTDLFGDPQNPMTRKNVLDKLDVGGGTADVFGDVELGVNLQLQEIQQMKDGKEVEVQPFHDQFTHQMVILRFLNSPEFPEIDDKEIQGRLIEHWQKHVKAIVGFSQAPPAEPPKALPSQPKPAER